MRTPYDYRFGLDQGRVHPQNHVISEDDLPQPATVVTGSDGNYALVDGDTLLLRVNGADAVSVTFDSIDFVDITSASPIEVAAVIGAEVPELIAVEDNNAVRLTTVKTGLLASIQIVGGLAQYKFNFPGTKVSGTQGHYSFVLGNDRKNEIWPFLHYGDRIITYQEAPRNNAKVVRVHGEARWPRLKSGYPPSLPTNFFYWRFFADDDTMGPSVPDQNLLYGGTKYTTTLDDVVLNITTLPDPVKLRLGLQLDAQAVTVARPGPVELPGIYLDFIELDTIPSAVFIGNRLPPPNEIAVPHSRPDFQFEIVNTSGIPIDLTITTVIVNGQIAYNMGSWVAPFVGGSITVPDTDAHDLLFTVPLDVIAPFVSEQPIEVIVNSGTAGITQCETTWVFYMADVQNPTVLSAQARDLKTVRVFFSEAMVIESINDPSYYSFSAQTVPAVPLQAIGVTVINSYTVDVALDIEMTMAATYRVTVHNAYDLQENVINASANFADFSAYRCIAPAGRSLNLWEKIPQMNRRDDDSSVDQPLRKFILCLQDVVDLLLCEIDHWTDIIDLDIAPEQFVDAILTDLGNPFLFVDLSLTQKRKLGRILVPIYKQKGTAEGVINAIRFFTGVEVTLDIFNYRDFWQIGIHNLNVNTIIGPGIGSPLWYSFFIVSTTILTDEQRDIMFKIADYMKCAHEHIVGIREPNGTPGDDGPGTKTYWRIGVHLLGTETILTT
jgi:phage tail-like protein